MHAWQAAIDEDAMVFTSHPLTAPKATDDWNDDDSPGYWTGEASMPRSAQHPRRGLVREAHVIRNGQFDCPQRLPASRRSAGDGAHPAA